MSSTPTDAGPTAPSGDPGERDVPNEPADVSRGHGRGRDAAARPGQLTPGWQIVVTLAWVAVLVALAGVWSTSRQLGLSTWWLGPPARPRPVWVVVAPFVAPAIVAVLALTGRRFVPWAGLVAAACVAAVGIGDLGRVTGLGVVELLIALAGALVSVAAFAGTYRRAVADTGTVDGLPAEGAAAPGGHAAPAPASTGPTTSGDDRVV